MLRISLIGLLLGLLPSVVLAADPTEHDMEAEHTLSMLVQLEEGPHLMLKACKAIDPKGHAAREKMYDGWKKKNQPLFAKIDQYANEVLPQLYAIVSPDDTKDAVKTFREKEINQMGQSIAGIDPDQRKQTCDDFPHAMFFNEQRNSAFCKHAFDLLDAWKKEHADNQSA